MKKMKSRKAVGPEREGVGLWEGGGRVREILTGHLQEHVWPIKVGIFCIANFFKNCS